MCRKNYLLVWYILMIIINTFVWGEVLTLYALVSVSTFSFSTDPYKNLLQAQYQNLRENLRILF